MPRLLIVAVAFFVFGCATPSRRAEAARDADSRILSLAADISVTMGWLKAVEGGNAEQAARGMRAHLVTQEMILRRSLEEYPDSPNAEKAAKILQRLQEATFDPREILQLLEAN